MTEAKELGSGRRKFAFLKSHFKIQEIAYTESLFDA